MPDAVLSVDAMGGDAAPGMVLDGIDQFVSQHSGSFEFLLHGDQAVLTPLHQAMTAAKDHCTIIHCPDHIPMDMKPSQALRVDSSMRRAIMAVRDKQAAATISAGNTGALMGLSMTIYGSTPGVRRPALAGSWPSRDTFTTVLDLGASVKADARQLVEYAIMGEAFARAIHRKNTPRVGLLNIGTEAAKGPEELRDADTMIRESELQIEYAGFVEGYDISAATVDVVVTDGFTGNVMIKSSEGTLEVVRRLLGRSLAEHTQIASTFQSDPALKKLTRFLDTSNFNGGVFLGLNGLTVKSHGAATAAGFANAIRIAADVANSSYASHVEANMQRLQQARSR